MEILKTLINDYLAEVIVAAIGAIITFFGAQIKSIVKDFLDTKTKQKLARICVSAVEQIYTKLHGEEKFEKCAENLAEMLAQKGIQITDIEIEMLIESAVNELNSAFSVGVIGSEVTTE